MLDVLRHRTYRRLFTAQVVALVGTGLATVALGLLAYDIAGEEASAVLGTALAIKMVAYVTVAPLVEVVAHRISRRTLLVTMDLTRATVALALPFVTQVWQVYALILLLQAASAAFTPAFQASLPTVLPDERDYTRALSMSRLAYDLESLFSPALAAGLLSLVSYNWLFAGTTSGFLASAALVVSCVLPKPAPQERGTRGAVARATLGVRLFTATPRLRALLALDLAVAAAGAMVIVNTVVLVRHDLGRSAGAVSVALAAYGAGSMLVALLLPCVLDRVGDRAVMLPAAFALPAVFAAYGIATLAGPSWPALLAAWFTFGAACSALLTPTGRLLRRSAAPGDLPAAFAAQFSLSHACWLVTYPLAGWLAATAGQPAAAWTLGALSLVGALTATLLWPARDAARLPHHHPDLPPHHPHLASAHATPTGFRRTHTHTYVIDELHRRWPHPYGAARG
ncbi:MFS transporter [Streptomyces cavernicola]|uniref:MFS transporter n=1 Tax=Streptomyces cavernicola TaxID=3043613 RepID=A0ABT6SAM0_9ACTN|nr:MFS transporter [Streptomyces sp. B-S-A6]MDI3405243.1 MFS transporter [Streptomyces sp. B-S-A6]